MEFQQTSLDQTGVAVLIMEDGSEKIIPLFSFNPIREVQELVKEFEFFSTCQGIKNVYFTNNLMETKIEDTIEKYREGHLCLPEDYMEELLSGFPYIFGIHKNTISFYS